MEVWEEESFLKEVYKNFLKVFLDIKKVIVDCIKYEFGRNIGIMFYLKYIWSLEVIGKLEKV